MSIQKTRNDIVNFSLTLIGVKAANEDAQDADLALAAEGLDDMVKMWQADGAHLWSRRSFTQFLKPAQIEYQIGDQALELSSGLPVDPDKLDHATETYENSTLAAEALTGAFTVVLDSSVAVTCDEDSPIQVNDYIVFQTASDGWWWSQVKQLTPPSTVMLTTAIPSDLAEGTVTNWYTEMLGKALRVPDMRRQQGFPPTSSEIQMEQMGRIDYLNLPNKLSSGTPVQFYYNPQINSGQLFVWPAPTTNDLYLNGTYYRPLDVFDDADSAADFPNEWLAALKYNLAVHLSPAFGGREPAQTTVALAVSYLTQAKAWDQGDSPTYFEYAKGRGFG